MSVSVTRHTSCTRSDSRCAICATEVTDARADEVRIGLARIDDAESMADRRLGTDEKTEVRGAASALPLPRRRGSAASGVAATRWERSANALLPPRGSTLLEGVAAKPPARLLQT